MATTAPYYNSPRGLTGPASPLTPSSLSDAASPSSTPGPSTPTAPDTRRKHRCSQCDKAFTTSGHLARHIKMHTGERAHKCPFPGCETACSRQDNLQQHYRVHLSPLSKRVSSTATRAAMSRDRQQATSDPPSIPSPDDNSHDEGAPTKRRRRSKREPPIVPLLATPVTVPSQGPATILPAPPRMSRGPTPPPSPPLTPPALEQAPLDVLMGLRAPRVLPGTTHVPMPILHSREEPMPPVGNAYPPLRGDRGYGIPVEVNPAPRQVQSAHHVGAVSYQQAAASSTRHVPSAYTHSQQHQHQPQPSSASANASPPYHRASDSPNVSWPQPDHLDRYTGYRTTASSDGSERDRSDSPPAPQYQQHPQHQQHPHSAFDTRLPPPAGYESSSSGSWSSARSLPHPSSSSSLTARPSHAATAAAHYGGVTDAYPVSQGPFRSGHQGGYGYPQTPVSVSSGESSRFGSPFDPAPSSVYDKYPTSSSSSSSYDKHPSDGPRYHSPLPALSSMVSLPPSSSTSSNESARYGAQRHRRTSPAPVLPPIHALTSDRSWAAPSQPHHSAHGQYWTSQPPPHPSSMQSAYGGPAATGSAADELPPLRAKAVLYPPRPTLAGRARAA